VADFNFKYMDNSTNHFEKCPNVIKINDGHIALKRSESGWGERYGKWRCYSSDVGAATAYWNELRDLS
jgi:hypothetical protein